MRRAIPEQRRSGAGGFTLIEVLIALAILAVGLLGVGMMQTLNLRYTRAADQRSKAVNLANELTDMVRANRAEMGAYTAITPGSFSGVSALGAGGCAVTANVSAANNITRWRCEVREQLGEEATAEVTIPAAGQLQVRVSWDEMTSANALDARTVSLVTRL